MNKKIIFTVAGVVILGVILGMVLNSGKKQEAEEVKKREALSFDVDTINQLRESNKYTQARELLRQKKELTRDASAIKQVQEKIYELNMEMLFSPYEDECSKIYTVKQGDALVKIAQEYNTTVALIKKANDLPSNRIVPGQELKVNICEFSVVVDKSQNLLFLRRKGEIFNSYVVATGKGGNTPEGRFKIVNKLVEPTWYRSGAILLPDDPDNILGSRWMGFDKAGYGIHGTTEPETLGQQITLGCIRMANEDVEELYDIIPAGTEVIVVE